MGYSIKTKLFSVLQKAFIIWSQSISLASPTAKLLSSPHIPAKGSREQDGKTRVREAKRQHTQIDKEKHGERGREEDRIEKQT